MTRKRDYEVGRGKPPKHTQFKKGESGNPRGRPRGGLDYRTIWRDMFKAPVKVTQNGVARSMPTIAAGIWRLRELALSGDLRALDKLLQSAEKYCEDELRATVRESVNDSDLLEIYKQRLLSGATSDRIAMQATASHPDQGDAEPAVIQKSTGRVIERYRLIKRPPAAT